MTSVASQSLARGFGNDGRSFIGSVLILPEQLVGLFDERQRPDGCVRLVCTNPTDAKVVIWHNLVKTGDLNSPVKLSNTTVRSEGTNLLTFAVGLRVFLIRFRQQESGPHINVGAISSLKIEDVNPGSWVASINAHFSLDGDNIDFFVSIQPSQELRGYSVKGELIKTFDIASVAPSIKQIASAGNMYAAVCDGNDGVILLKSVGPIRRCGSLKPSERGIYLRASSVIWTGSKWLVLGVNRQGSSWAVSVYERTGEMVKVCDEGSCSDHGAAPVSLTRFGNSGVVSFADGGTRMFKF